MPAQLDHAAFVRAATAIKPVPMVPEILLHQSADAIGLWERTELELGESDRQPPFWAFAWAGGQALARYILDHPQVTAGRRVLDLGSGSGLTAIAAAVTGAESVLASELDPIAIAAIGLNAALNNVSVSTTGDLLDTDGGDAQVVLAADIWYERRLSARALRLLRLASARGATVLAGDVGRAFLPGEHMRDLAAYDIPVVAELENAAVKRTRIMTLR
ncbi:MAG TPA: 50S ribosomal protein L11 methyltransferase [Streptosporangiaceae bacterium]|nr:50S ribosomal protein L11 methyltransferase [Streptosporangiaceae bacterium]